MEWETNEAGEFMGFPVHRIEWANLPDQKVILALHIGDQANPQRLQLALSPEAARRLFQALKEALSEWQDQGSGPSTGRGN